MQREMTPERIKQIHNNVKRIALERSIVRALIRHMKERGWLVFCTYDGEAWEFPRTEAEAIEHVFGVDEMSLRFTPVSHGAKPAAGPQHKAARQAWAREGHKLSHGVLLVLGNGQDVIADWRYSEGDADGFSKSMDAFDVEQVGQPHVSREELDAAVARVASRGF